MNIRCLCNAINTPLSPLLSTSPSSFPPLPIPTEICHCSACRHTSGALCLALTALTHPPPAEILSKCTKYTITYKGCDRTEKWFCTACGTRLWDCTRTKEGKWFVCAGAIEPSGHSVGDRNDDGVRNVTRVVCHTYVSETGDGGLVSRLRRLSGRTVPCYSGSRGGGEMSESEFEKLSLQALAVRELRVNEDERLEVACHCRSIRVFVNPFKSSQRGGKDPEVTRWLRKEQVNRREEWKYLALNCACNYCRRAIGFTFASNCYVMPENISVAPTTSSTPSSGASTLTSGSPFNYTSRDESTGDLRKSAGPLREIFSTIQFDLLSKGIRRSWCGRCGASMFFERETRPQCVNIAMGVVRSTKGALARDFVGFDWEVWDRAFAVDGEVVEALGRGEVK